MQRTAPIIPSLLTVALLLVVLAGCGQSGPLYLPGNPSSMRTVPPAGETAGEDESGTDRREDGGSADASAPQR